MPGFTEVIIYVVLIFALNVVPAFAPPTWMALSWIGFAHPQYNPFAVALVGAVAATAGRVVLAKLSRIIIRQRFMSEASRTNIEVIKEAIEGHRALTAGTFLFFAFSPFASNFLFIAYGLTGLPLLRVALPFFVGRLASYGFFIVSGAAAGRHFEIDSMVSGAYALAWFIGTQLLILGALYCFTRVDWKVLFDNRKLVWLPKTSDERPIHLL